MKSFRTQRLFTELLSRNTKAREKKNFQIINKSDNTFFLFLM